MDSLWQRIGRAARGPGTEAVAVVLVEPKYFDEEKAAAAQRAEQRSAKRKEGELRKAVAAEQGKRKRAEDQTEGGETSAARPATRRRTEAPEETVDTAPSNAAPMATLPVLSECERLRIEYKTSEDAKSKKTPGKSKKTEGSATLSPELDNMVNAGSRQHKCFRAPIFAFYENDRVGECS